MKTRAPAQATEVADGVDQDCNGLIDDGAEVYDDDGDGYNEVDGDGKTPMLNHHNGHRCRLRYRNDHGRLR